MNDHFRGIERHWVLKSNRRDFFLCASGGEDPRPALCVFHSREAAEEHLRGLSEPKLYLDTLERHGTRMPRWMNEDPLLPEPREVTLEQVRKILTATEVGYVAVGREGEPKRMEVLLVEEFL
jgi:hypothetical protein